MEVCYSKNFSRAIRLHLIFIFIPFSRILTERANVVVVAVICTLMSVKQWVIKNFVMNSNLPQWECDCYIFFSLHIDITYQIIKLSIEFVWMELHLCRFGHVWSVFLSLLSIVNSTFMCSHNEIIIYTNLLPSLSSSCICADSMKLWTVKISKHSQIESRNNQFSTYWKIAGCRDVNSPKRAMQNCKIRKNESKGNWLCKKKLIDIALIIMIYIIVMSVARHLSGTRTAI